MIKSSSKRTKAISLVNSFLQFPKYTKYSICGYSGDSYTSPVVCTVGYGWSYFSTDSATVACHPPELQVLIRLWCCPGHFGGVMAVLLLTMYLKLRPASCTRGWQSMLRDIHPPVGAVATLAAHVGKCLKFYLVIFRIPRALHV